MWKIIFYGFWMIYFMNELYTVFDPHRSKKLASKLFKQSRDEHGRKISLKWNDIEKDDKDSLKKSIFILAPAIFLRFVGLFSFNWLIFLIWILIGFLLSPVSKEMMHRYVDRNNIMLVWTSFVSLINAAFALFVILNSYHFYINNTDLFNRLISVF